MLAASAYQLAAITTAKKLGWRVITTDNNRQNPGHSLADESYNVDTTDMARVLEIARHEQIDGVISPGTDVAVATAAYVAEQLRLPGPPVSAAQILTNKLEFRKFQSAAGLPHPQAFAISSHSLPALSTLNRTRWIIKPNRASGSRGVFILENTGDFAHYRHEAACNSADGVAVLEQYLPGSQHTCEGILRDGLIAFAVVTDRDTAPHPYTATTGHRVPSNLGATAQTSILTMLQELFCKLGVTEGPFDCDFIVGGDTVTLIEVTPRLGGNSLPVLIRAAYDIDIVEYAIKQACGIPAELPQQLAPVPSAVQILGVDRAGAFYFDKEAADALKQEPWVRELCLDYAIGNEVEPFINGRNRVGEALVVGENRIDIDQKVKLLHIRLGLTTL